jgi:hypothetical protein
VTVVVLVLLWGTVAVRLPTLWRDRRQRALWTSAFALALTRTAAFGPVASRLHMPVLPNLLGVVTAYCLLRFIALITGTGPRRWQVALTAAVLIALGALATADGHIENTPAALSAPLPAAAVAYWVVLEGYLGAVLASATILFRSVGRAAPAGLPRLGLRAMAAGLATIALYATSKIVLVVAHAFGVRVPFDRTEPVSHVVQAAAILVAVAGSLVPATGRARAVFVAYGNLLALRPLWRAMRDAFPEVILFSPRRAVIELAGVDDVHLRLYRRVIEIRDGMLALRDFRPEHVPPGDDTAVTEARGIALALRRRAEGAEPAERAEAWAAVGPEMADEVAWLRRVSAAFRRLAG